MKNFFKKLFNISDDETEVAVEDQAAERIRIAEDKLQQTRDIAEAKLQVEKMKRTAEDRRTKERGKKK